jgi:two-component system sensor histidine kinase DesK
MPDEDRTPATACERQDSPFDPTGMFMPGAVPVTPADVWRKRIAINISFLWLAFPVLDLAQSHPHPLRAAVVGGALLAYLAAYNSMPRQPPELVPARSSAPVLALLGLITTALTLADRASWSLLFVFTAISGAMRLPRRAAVLWILVCTLLTATTNLVAGSDAASTVSLTATTIAIGLMMYAFRRLMELNRALMSAREEVARLAVSEERLRFARDLHDLLGHGLTVIAVKAELAEQLLAREAPDAAAEHVADIKTVARNALSEVREAVSGYRRPTLTSELSGARIALQAAGIEARLDAAADAPLDPEVEAVLAWAVREGTTNVIRHSGARSCRIAVRPGPPAASAEVVDDGRAVQPNGTGSGLAGLRERAEHMAGRLEAGPAPGGGFRLFVTVPVRERAT